MRNHNFNKRYVVYPILAVMIALTGMIHAEELNSVEPTSVIELRADDISLARSAIIASAQKHGKLAATDVTDNGSRLRARIIVPSNEYGALLRDLGGAGKIIKEKSAGAADGRDSIVEVNVQTQSVGLKLPDFGEALFGILNALLGLLYVLIWFSPLLIGYGIYRLLRKKKVAAPPASPGAPPESNLSVDRA